MDGEGDQSNAPRLICFVFADISAADEGLVRGRLQADVLVSERLDRCFDIFHSGGVPTLVSVQ